MKPNATQGDECCVKKEVNTLKAPGSQGCLVSACCDLKVCVPTNSQVKS